MNLRIDSIEGYANFRATPNTSQNPLTRLPVGHLVVTTGAAQNGWQPCQTASDGDVLNGFVHTSLLREEINPEVDRLVAAAGVEFKEFKWATRTESQPGSSARIRQYWEAAGFEFPGVGEAWSAVFISFVVRQAALARFFKFHKRHTQYLSDSKVAKMNGDATRAYWAVRLGDRKLQLGDLVGAYRTGNGCGSAVRTYDSLPGDFCSHCDIVVAIRGNKAYTIGGNVEQTVRVSEVPLTADGKAKTGGKRITIMAKNS